MIIGSLLPPLSFCESHFVLMISEQQPGPRVLWDSFGLSGSGSPNYGWLRASYLVTNRQRLPYACLRFHTLRFSRNAKFLYYCALPQLHSVVLACRSFRWSTKPRRRQDPAIQHMLLPDQPHHQADRPRRASTLHFQCPLPGFRFPADYPFGIAGCNLKTAYHGFQFGMAVLSSDSTLLTELRTLLLMPKSFATKS